MQKWSLLLRLSSVVNNWSVALLVKSLILSICLVSLAWNQIWHHTSSRLPKTVKSWEVMSKSMLEIVNLVKQQVRWPISLTYYHYSWKILMSSPKISSLTRHSISSWQVKQPLCLQLKLLFVILPLNLRVLPKLATNFSRQSKIRLMNTVYLRIWLRVTCWEPQLSLIQLRTYLTSVKLSKRLLGFAHRLLIAQSSVCQRISLVQTMKSKQEIT